MVELGYTEYFIEETALGFNVKSRVWNRGMTPEPRWHVNQVANHLTKERAEFVLAICNSARK